MLILSLCCAVLTAPPVFLEDRFEIPVGFRIYKAASAELAGGSYDLCLDADGRLLVGDGSQVRRLTDQDGDGVYDAQEVIATGLGPRGPQGLCLWGDRLFAVGGDGIQLFEGYHAGKLVPRGRLGAKFNTGGDHDAHTIFRGPDDWLYFITGDGGGTKDRKHITESTSPVIFERSCSVFRFSADGSKWECVGSGGRNSPNLGMNYLGELFSLDSDMEWHVDLPWWRPVRLHHWIQGGDQGWQDVGAFPPYYVDCLPGIGDVGRGSPDWGIFYEHTQLPAKYRDAYLVCDYLTKSATTGGYESAGRLFAFFLQRDGAGWKSSWETLARPKPGARDDRGNAISFALVDVEVAVDGSLLVSDHNQGVWRIFHDATGTQGAGIAPPLLPARPPPPTTATEAVSLLINLPQPGSEFAQSTKTALRQQFPDWGGELTTAALARARPLRERLGALRHLAAEPSALLAPASFAALAQDPSLEIRALTAWLVSLEPQLEARRAVLGTLLADREPFVRRRALEAVTRLGASAFLDEVLAALEDPDRLVSYTAMVALSHWPTSTIVEKALGENQPTANRRRASIRALIATDLRREPAPDEVIRRVVSQLLSAASPVDGREGRLDLLRLLGRFQRVLKGEAASAEQVTAHLLSTFPSADQDLFWEEARLLGEYGATTAFDQLVASLEKEKDSVTQFHLAQAIARIPRGWSSDAEERAVRWFASTQRGWFADPAGKGLQFPHYWSTVLADFASKHIGILGRRLSELDVASQLGGVVVDQVAKEPDGEARLVALARSKDDPKARRRVLTALGQARGPRAAELLREEYLRTVDPETRSVVLRALAPQPASGETYPLLEEGLMHPDRDTARACLQGLNAYTLELTESLARRLVAELTRRPDLFHGAEKLLARVSGKARPGANANAEIGRRPAEGEHQHGSAFWRAWYEERFARALDLDTATGVPERSDAEIHAHLLGDACQGGDTERGRAVYTALRCAACHGGVARPGEAERIFGPELVGATRRLTRVEVADAIVYPSKQVADRFKATLLQHKDGSLLTGFITERTAEVVTLVDQERVHRLAPSDIVVEETLATSLMPERLLNRLSNAEVCDLVAFLDTLGARGEANPGDSTADWPQWRGPGGRGVATGPAPPDRWSERENLLWSVTLPGWGTSSPTIAGERVYLTAQNDTDALLVTALERSTGVTAWSLEVGKGRLKTHQLHNMATPTPAADARHVWALFGTGDLVALTHSGAELWRRNLATDHGEYKILWGMGSSPILHNGLLYTVCIHPGPSYVLAMDAMTGKDVWKTERKVVCENEATDSYSSPVLLELPARTELIVSGCDHLTGYDPGTGQELWRSSGLKINHAYGRTMASPGVGPDIIVGPSASVQGLGKIVAVRPGGSGDVSQSHRSWQYDKFTPDCPSPLVHGGLVYVIRDDGVASCLDVRDGELKWRQRLARGSFKSSPLACDDRIYFLGEEGDCVVVRAGPTADIIAENHVDGHFIATPAIARGVIYLRSREKLFAIGNKKP